MTKQLTNQESKELFAVAMVFSKKIYSTIELMLFTKIVKAVSGEEAFGKAYESVKPEIKGYSLDMKSVIKYAESESASSSGQALDATQQPISTSPVNSNNHVK